MTSDINQVCATFGFPVMFRDISGRFGLKVGLDRGKLTEEQYDFAVKNMALPPGMHELCKDTDVIIECIPKFLALKMRTFKELVVTL